MESFSHYSKQILIGFIRIYGLAISKLLGNCCRFSPSCSVYTMQALEKHGCIKGCWFGTLRILRCHPWHQGGVDEVP